MMLYNLTGYGLFAEMAQISSNSGELGGIAWHANLAILADHPDIYAGDDSNTDLERISIFSTHVFLYDFAQITQTGCTLGGEPIYGIPSELDMAQAAYDAWLDIDPGFANIAPPFVRLFQEENGTIVTMLASGGSLVLPAISPAIPVLVPEIEAFNIVTAAVASEAVNPQGFYRFDFYDDHGGYHNIDIDYSDDCKYVTLSGNKSDLVGENKYEAVNTGPDKNVIVLQTTFTEWAHCLNTR